MTTTTPNIAIIGLGNVGWNLALRLNACGYSVHQVLSRHPQEDDAFIRSIGAQTVNEVSQLQESIDLIFLCTPDDTLADLAASIEHKASLVHCSGSAPVLRPRNSGVLYAFQTFTKGVAVSWEGIPIFIESNTDALETMLTAMARQLSGKFSFVNATQRKLIHISGVFGANFVNHMLYEATRVLDRADLPFEVLKPLLHEVIRKALEHGPKEAQTGPARRGDHDLIKNHLEELQSDPHLHDLYKVLSEQISTTYQE